MAVVTKSSAGGHTPATPAPPSSCRVGPFFAGEDLPAGCPVYLKSDGKIWKANGTAANALAVVIGWTVEPILTTGRQPCSVYKDITIEYGTGLTPGALYYLAATAGAIDTAATTGGTAPIAYAVDATRIRIRSNV